jgi:DNA helicase II / ATP-dependent DNA helicase PcrA
MTPTPEQLAIIEAAQNDDRNLLVSALAGAAKTSTLVLVAEALPDVNILCLAFNKKIAVEMGERLPPNCKAMTLNALGHRTWSEATGRRLRIEASKTYEIVKALIEDQTRDDQRALYENMADLMRTVDFGKACGYIPTGTYERGKRLMEDEDFFGHLEQRLSPLEEDIIRAATLESLKQAFAGTCDFNDQILMPTLFHGAFPRYPLILVDEAQDLSALNHATLRKLAKRRLIAVGDQCQAIYGFRGAHEDSMAKLKETFEIRELMLSVSFRCPQAIVEHVRWRAPHMKWPEWARAGSVRTLAAWRADDIEEDATIICRNNAPLFGIAIRLLKNGRTCELDGKDIITQITKVLRKFGSSDMRQQDVLDRIDAWLAAELEKSRKRAHERICDRAECMRIFAREGSTLGDALAYAQHLMHLHSPLKLMTGHKAKGLEFDHVYFLDASLVGREDQDPNLRYVICTRAKETLTYINSERFVDNETDMALSAVD